MESYSYLFLLWVLLPCLAAARLFWLLIEARQRNEDLKLALETAAESLRYYRAGPLDATEWLEGKLYLKNEGPGFENPESPGLEASNTLSFISDYLKPEPPCKHQFIKQQASGNPADVRFSEWIEVCRFCGEEK